MVKEFRKNGVASFLLDNLVAYLTGGGGPQDDPQSSVNDISGCKLLILEVLLLELFQQMFDGYDINSVVVFWRASKTSY